MENFKSTLKRRLYLMASFNCLAVIFIILTFFTSSSASEKEHIANIIHGFQVGIFIGVQLIFLINIAKYKKSLKQESELRKLFVEENDERRKLIQDKIGGVGFNFSLVVIAIATVTSGFFNEVVFITLSSVLIFISFVKGFLKFYYRKKF